MPAPPQAIADDAQRVERTAALLRPWYRRHLDRQQATDQETPDARAS